MMITKRNPVWSVFLWIFLLSLALLSVLPFYMMIINATRSNVEISRGVWLTPGNQLIRNYQIIESRVNIWRGFYASSIITVPSVLLSAFFSTLTAYGFAKFQFKGKEALFWVVLATMMVPQQLGLIGYFDLVRRLGLLDTFVAIILPSIANPGMVFFIRAYMQSSLPDSLLEAAIIDGAREFRIFLTIVVPLSLPAIATMSIFNFITRWNDLLTPLVLINSPEKFPMPVVISNIRGLYETNFGAIYLGIAISVIPILIIVVTFSRYIINGLTVGAIKG